MNVWAHVSSCRGVEVWYRLHRHHFLGVEPIPNYSVIHSKLSRIYFKHQIRTTLCSNKIANTFFQIKVQFGSIPRKDSMIGLTSLWMQDFIMLWIESFLIMPRWRHRIFLLSCFPLISVLVCLLNLKGYFEISNTL